MVKIARLPKPHIEMRATWSIFAVVLLCLLASPASAPAADESGEAKVDDSVTTVLEATGADEAVPVIVYTDPGAQAVVDGVAPTGVETTDLPGFDAVAAYLTADEIGALAASDLVDLIVADNPVFGFDYATSMDITNLSIGLDRIASPASGGPDGDGVGVAVIDSGVATTSDLGADRVTGWKDFVNKKKTPYDDAGHGTFVAGLIAGDGSASLPLEDGGYAEVQFRGVAPAADIIALKVLDATGQGRASGILAAVAWAIRHKDDLNIRVINLSVGSNPVAPTEFDPIALATELAWKAGITVVCAAGNEGEFGSGGILSPGNSPYVITVGASDTRQTPRTSDDTPAYYSSVGPTLWDEFAKPDLLAPGNRLISVRVRGSYIDREFPQNRIAVDSYAPEDPDRDPDYLVLSGTSTSSPVVAGVAALMIGQDPALSPDDVKVRMMASADPIKGISRFQQGAGLIDAAGALESDRLAHGYALSEDVGDGTTILTEDDYAAWDQTVWAKYGWTKFKWTKFKWTKFKWTKFKWTKFKWTKFKWTKFKWTKFKWTDVAWSKFKWTKFKWTDVDWAKFKWTILTEGQ